MASITHTYSNGQLRSIEVDDYGTTYYRLNDVLHREDGPAIEHEDGSKVWYINGEHHRIGGPAVEYIGIYNTRIEWWVNGKLHREDGPAFEGPTGKTWFRGGNVHRLDGPAVIWADGTEAWYYNDKEIKCNSQEEFLRIIKLKAFW